MLNHPDRLLPLEDRSRAIAQELYASIAELPLICPHGHTNAGWFAKDEEFPDPANLIIVPDHYIFRMLVSQGLKMEDLGVPRRDGGATESDSRKIWRLFAKNYYLFRGTPTRAWLDYTFEDLFGLSEPLSEETADTYFDTIADCLKMPEYRPRALFERFNIEVLATTEGALDPLSDHKAIIDSDWNGRVVTTFRPDSVIDPSFETFHDDLDQLADITNSSTDNWDSYLEALRIRRAFFRDHGATATDHGVTDAQTANLSTSEASALFDRVRSKKYQDGDIALFRHQMMTEMAKMSVEDGMVMQIHPGSMRNHNAAVFDRHGRDMGFDIPTATNYVSAIKPLLDAVGDEAGLSIILFTLDETSYTRELAPLTGAYPCLKLGPPWWFHDSYEGMMRFRTQVTETSGFYNTVGFNDDTRAFPSIPARHDVARRVDCAYLANLVSSHRIREDEAFELIKDLTYKLPKAAYNF